MGVGVAQFREQLLEVDLVRVWVAVEAEGVDALGVVGLGGIGGYGGCVEGGAEGVFVGVEEDVCAVVFVVTVFYTLARYVVK